MRESIGDLWAYPAEYRVVTTNGVLNSKGELVMGAGVALQAKKLFPALPGKLGRSVKLHGNRPFLCEEERLITFPTKGHWRDKSGVELVRASARKVVDLADRMRVKSVAMTRPGCGLGGLKWSAVRPVLEPILDDRFVVLTPP